MALYRAQILVDTSSAVYYESAKSMISALTDEIKRHGLDREVKVVETGYLGICSDSLVIVIYPDGVAYVNLSTNDAEEIITEHLLKGRHIKRLMYKGYKPPAASYTKNSETRVVLRNIGIIDPNSIEEYIAMGGYETVVKAITRMSPQDVIEEIRRSGLIGRSGLGLPAADKWDLARQTRGNKSVICNAAACEPGSFKDSIIFGGDPHSIIEGMLIAGYAVGANSSWICVGNTCRHSAKYIRRAIDAAYNMGFIDSDFKIDVVEIADDFVYSEENILYELLQGRRGEPSTHSSENDSAVIHCAETFVDITHIIASGAGWFSKIGTPLSTGTKVYCLTGDVVRPGVYEAPFGATLRDIIYNLAGGIRNGKHMKAALLGGPSGTVVGRGDLDRQLCMEDMFPGTGTLVVLDEDKCAVDLAANIAQIFDRASCGLCTPCRNGTRRISEMLSWLTSGAGCEHDLDLLKDLAQILALASRCNIGRWSSSALMSSLPLFENEFLAHARDKICPSGICAMDKVFDEVY